MGFYKSKTGFQKLRLGSKVVDESALADGYIPVYNSTTNKFEYLEGVTGSALRPPDDHDASTTNFPTDYKGNGNVSEGDSFAITVAGTMGASTTVNIGDLLISKIDTPGQTDANWIVVESNRDQATETVLGVSKIATQAITNAGTNDTDTITALKLDTYFNANLPTPVWQDTGTQVELVSDEKVVIKGDTSGSDNILELIDSSDDSVFSVSDTGIITSEGLKSSSPHASGFYGLYIDNATGLVYSNDAVVTKYDATVGAVGADYTTLSAAVAAGHTTILAVDNVTENANITVASNTIIELDGYDLDMVTFNATGSQIDINGGSITYAYTIAGTVFNNSDIKITNCTIDNNSTVSSTILCRTGSIDGCTFNLPNLNECALGRAGFDFILGSITNCNFVGGGTSCYRAIYTSNNTYMVAANIYLGGTFANNTVLFLPYPQHIMRNVYYDSSSSCNMLVGNCISLIDKTNKVTAQVVIGFIAQSYINKLEMRNNTAADSCEVTVASTLSSIYSNQRLVNCRFVDDLTIQSDGVKISNSSVGGDLSLTGDFISIQSTTVSGLVSISGVNNIFSGGHIGTTAETITLNVGADNNIITSNFTKALISDSGIGNEILSNLLF